MSGTDVIAQARAHAWWHSDQSLAFSLIHEIEELRADNARLRSNLRAAAEQIEQIQDSARPSPGRRQASTDMNWTRTNLEDDILWVPMEEAEEKIDRLRDAAVIARTTEANLHEEIERLREHLTIQAEGEADDAIKAGSYFR